MGTLAGTLSFEKSPDATTA